MSATHAGSTSGGNLCHLFVRRARNLAMSKSVAAVVVMRLLRCRAALGRQGSAELSPGGDADTTSGVRLMNTVLSSRYEWLERVCRFKADAAVPDGAARATRDRPMPSMAQWTPASRGGDDERSAVAPRRRYR